MHSSDHNPRGTGTVWEGRQLQVMAGTIVVSGEPSDDRLGIAVVCPRFYASQLRERSGERIPFLNRER